MTTPATSPARLFIPPIADSATERSIDVTDPRDIDYWTEALGVTETELRLAVAAVGSSVQDVRDHLGC
ncbi:DUF3606 domain-containing protein [Variovorax sp. JS1663]|uniref:DUF3606 domain-containing protein n=1 Tax=Variovorax sp. JS1663 TaxID=1851577 RepID=UPI000B3447A2|nr:DUF3606 domain-containing protein [Variovorax sp. JS1663]OUM02204.1 hypothetical protein A8M77_12515 [Variovorax sp. JS1663]